MRKILTNENLFVLDGHDKDGESLESEASEESEGDDDAALDSDEEEGAEESEEDMDDEAGSDDDEDGEEAEETEDTGVAEPKKKRGKVNHAEVSEEEKVTV